MADDGRELDIEPTGPGQRWQRRPERTALRRTSAARPARSRAGTAPARLARGGSSRLAGDPRRAHRPRRHHRRRPQGQVRDPGLGHAEGDRPDQVGVRVRAGRRAEPRLRRAARTASRHARAQGRPSRPPSRSSRRRVQAAQGKAGIESVGDPFATRRSPTTDASRTQRRSSRRRSRPQIDPRSSLSRTPSARRWSRLASPPSSTARPSPADPAGDPGAARVHGRLHRAPDRLPHVRRDLDPDRAGARGRRNGVHPALHPRRADRHQHDHADPRLDDRHRRRDRLLALHRHPLQTAPARGSFPGATLPRRPVARQGAPCSSRVSRLPSPSRGSRSSASTSSRSSASARRSAS